MKTLSSLLIAVALLVGLSAAITGQQPAQPKQAAPLSPAESLKRFEVPDDLQVDLVLSEPTIAQPIFTTFDERGRMWVMEYRQYPFPAGLKLLSHDRFWRTVYDKVPPPPPNHFKGKDRISIHEDVGGDGTFKKHKVFVDGLNIATSCARGRGGVWVLNPPYLLFYPDRDNDDVPDGDPEVHLEGFGLEDTHSVVNSLCWGPDGWLYAAQGSTVSGNVKRYGTKDKPVHSMGQLIWRYHPETHRYEIFAEGGGNAFGVEIDSKGRVYSGHNGGDTRGFHYVQGGYYRKGFDKHGPLSNPYAYGYFPPMKHPQVKRFSHTFVINEAPGLPERYRGNLFAVDPLQARIFFSEIKPDTSSFQTKDLGTAVASSDQWFRPVHLSTGPDGALYFSDFYDLHIAHLRHHEGQIDSDNGRVYRLSAKGAKPAPARDLSKLSTPELVALLADESRWVRQTALRLIGDRKDRSIIPSLKKLLAEKTGQLALEALWALNLSGGLDESTSLTCLAHADPYVRLWTVRLLGDSNRVPAGTATRLAGMARKEPHVEVRSQLACTARRLPAADGLRIVRELLWRDEDVQDLHLPLLLWWAVEAKAESDRDAVVKLFSEKAVWKLPMVEQHLLERVMRRYAQAGTQEDLRTCAKLLNMAPEATHAKKLLAGFEQAFAGRSVAALPLELVTAIDAHGGGSLALRLRAGKPEALGEALKKIEDAKAPKAERVQLVQVLGEIKEPRSVPILLGLLDQKDDALLMATLGALQPHSQEGIGQAVARHFNEFSPDVRAAAETLLSSRPAWSVSLLTAVDAGKVDPKKVSETAVRRLLVHKDGRLGPLVRKHWGLLKGATTEEMRKEVERLAVVVRASSGDPAEGKKLFNASCGKCHTLFGEGGAIGPDLTTFKRDDIDNVLLHVINPSAEIREGFENYLVSTDDGRTLNGFLVEKDNRVVVLRGVDGQNITIARDRVEDMRVLPISLMPEGLLKGLTDQQVRDLFAYLRGGQPLQVPK
jgi:putative heme-binding domain-containing protein